MLAPLIMMMTSQSVEVLFLTRKRTKRIRSSKRKLKQKPHRATKKNKRLLQLIQPMM